MFHSHADRNLYNNSLTANRGLEIKMFLEAFL